MPLISDISQKGTVSKIQQEVEDSNKKIYPSSPIEYSKTSGGKVSQLKYQSLKTSFEQQQKAEKQEWDKYWHLPAGEAIPKSEYSIYVNGEKLDIKDIPDTLKNFEIRSKKEEYLMEKQGKDKYYGSYFPRILTYKEGSLVSDIKYQVYKDPTTEKAKRWIVGENIIKEYKPEGYILERGFKEGEQYKQHYWDYMGNFLGGESGRDYFEPNQYLSLPRDNPYRKAYEAELRRQKDPEYSIPPDVQKYLDSIKNQTDPDYWESKGFNIDQALAVAYSKGAENIGKVSDSSGKVKYVLLPDTNKLPISELAKRREVSKNELVNALNWQSIVQQTGGTPSTFSSRRFGDIEIKMPKQPTTGYLTGGKINAPYSSGNWFSNQQERFTIGGINLNRQLQGALSRIASTPQFEMLTKERTERNQMREWGNKVKNLI